MNRLPIKTREQIARLLAEGRTVREVAAITKCNRATVQSLSIHGYRKKVYALIAAAHAVVDTDDDGEALDGALTNLSAYVGWTCPIHPENEDLDDDPVALCTMCRSAGLERHHERRKDEGRPIVPPWHRPQPSQHAPRPKDRPLKSNAEMPAPAPTSSPSSGVGVSRKPASEATGGHERPERAQEVSAIILAAYQKIKNPNLAEMALELYGDGGVVNITKLKRQIYKLVHDHKMRKAPSGGYEAI